jgi:hypothetical protein
MDYNILIDTKFIIVEHTTQKSFTNLLLPQNVEDDIILAHDGNYVALPFDLDF